MQKCGGRRLAVRQGRELNMRPQATKLQNIKGDRHIFSTQAASLINMFEYGAGVDYYGSIPYKGRDPVPPEKRIDSSGIPQMFRISGNEDKVFFSSGSYSVRSQVATTPTDLSHKRNPDREISAHRRLPSDLRWANICSAQQDFYTACMPDIHDILTDIVRLNRKYYSMAAQMCRRDVSGSLTLIY